MASCSTDIEGLQAPTSSISTSGDDQESLFITVESSCSKNMQFSEEHDILLTLAIPNRSCCILYRGYFWKWLAMYCTYLVTMQMSTMTSSIAVADGRF